jgi:outer membrane receptor protein involved in Fe transport
MVYARLASGYRPGGPNIVQGVPQSYGPDKTENYEVGAKGDFLEHRLSIDTSVYYIDWKSLQLNLVDPTTLFGFTGNAGRARSRGIEFSTELRPSRGLTLSGWIAYNEAELTDWPAAAQAATAAGLGPYAYAGDRLPLSPRVSGDISISQRWPLTDRVTARVEADLSYVGDRKGVFPTVSPERQDLPAYAKTDFRFGADYEAWRANLFLNNVFDRRGLVSGGLGTDLPYSFYYIQPRTVGISLAREF